MAISAGEEFTADMAFSLRDDAQVGVMYELPYATYFGECVMRDSYYIQVGQSIEGFESGDLHAFDWHYSSIIYAWDVVTENPYEGVYCAKSTSIQNSETSLIYIDVEVEIEGEVSFYYKVSSEYNWDKLFFKIDDENKAEWSGDIDWTQASFVLTPGTHRLTWAYTKDSSLSSGEDCAWIDNVSFPASTIIADVQEIVEKQDVMVYPNPANDVLNISLGDMQAEVLIYNSLGQEVRHINAMSGDVQINIEDLNSGVYFVKINGAVTKLIKR